MIGVTQTKRGGPDAPPEERGDCFDACVASILEVDVADTHVPHTDDWWDQAQHAVERHGYRLVYLGEQRTPADALGEWLGPVYWLAGVDSLNLGVDADGTPVGHVVVMRGRELVHDPSLGKRYPLGPLPADVPVRSATLLVPLHPLSVKQAAACDSTVPFHDYNCQTCP